jgi:hypothetical protein
LEDARSVADARSLLDLGGFPLNVTIAETQVVTLTIATAYSSFFAAEHNTPNGNLPAAYGNQVLVFSGGPAIQPGAPIGTQTADPNGGTIVMPASGTFPASPLVCAYAVGPPATAGGKTIYPIAASAYLPQGSGTTVPVKGVSPGLGIQAAHTAFIVWTYAFPAGVNPAGNGAWIALWEGTVVPYKTTPACAVAITQASSTGMAPMPGLMLSGNTQYVGALFASGYDADIHRLDLTAIAAVVLFSTGPPAG